MIAALVALVVAASLDVPFVRQEKNGCGAASVAMITAYWKTSAPDAKAVYEKLIDAERRGIKLADMKAHLEGLGYSAFTLRGRIADIETHVAKGRPVIVGLRKGLRDTLHFVVVTGVEGDFVQVNDPTRNKPRLIRRGAFDQQWERGERWMLLATPAS